MLSEFLFYLVGILAMVGGILLLERIVAGPHSTAGTGYARVDSAFDFDRLRRKQYGPRAPSVPPRWTPDSSAAAGGQPRAAATSRGRRTVHPGRQHRGVG